MKFIDLSSTIENNVPSDPPGMLPEIDYRDHEVGAEHMLEFFPSATRDDLPGGLGWALEYLQICTHNGTHLDAPYHYHPTLKNGERAIAIDEIPLEWCYADGVKLDLSDKPDGYLVTRKDIEEALADINYNLQSGDIVLVYTGAAEKWGTAEYLSSGCGMGREATLWILNQGIKIVGTDAWSWDRPLSYIAEEFRESKDSSLIWEGHFAGIEKEYCHMEKLMNLDRLPGTGFKIICFPIKLKGCSAAWVRPVAIIE